MVLMPHWPKSPLISCNRDDLSDIKRILDNLGNPEKSLPPIIHVAGTNGKASTISFLQGIFTSANYKIHAHMSPHIHRCNERIIIAGEEISDDYLYQILEEVRLSSGNINLTFSEAMIIAAILTFSRNDADICFIEAGMGGRIDPTNAIDDKILSIITPISFDHEKFLGQTIYAIASEKSHIMRTNIPAIIGPQALDAGKAIEIRSLVIDNVLKHFDQDFDIEINENNSFNFKYGDSLLQNLPKPSLEGEHQYINSSLAIATIFTLEEFYPNKFTINENDIRNGLENAKNPGRLEKIDIIHPHLDKNDEIWLDGAHNIGGFYALARWLEERIVDDEINDIERENYLLVGFTEGKVREEFFSFFEEMIDFVCSIRVSGEPNPENAEIIANKVVNINNSCKDDMSDAINFLSQRSKKSCRIIICGSLYLARDLREFCD
ncbi:MAG: dihydrofolate synthase/folylpolyglutamate synthase [Rickettsiales bacterium]|jgi:dihydrofolate synthase/folylpolyglutamate synthase